MTAGALLTLLLGFPRRSDIPEYDVADLPALREIDIDALLPQIPDADPLFQAALREVLAALRSTNDRALELKAQGRRSTRGGAADARGARGPARVPGCAHAGTLYSATQLALLLQDQGGGGGDAVGDREGGEVRRLPALVCERSPRSGSRRRRSSDGGDRQGPRLQHGPRPPRDAAVRRHASTGRPTRPAPTTAAHSAPPTPSGTRTRRRASRCTTLPGDDARCCTWRRRTSVDQMAAKASAAPVSPSAVGADVD